MPDDPNLPAPQPAGLQRFKDAEYTVFLSYAHAANQLCGNWMGDFALKLERDLNAELSDVLEGGLGAKVHLSQKNGPIKGELSQELRERVVRSFAMVIVVEEKYVGSSWCLNELETFKARFGAAGLDSRLYILALSKPAIVQLEQKPSWARVFAERSQVWMPFFMPDGDGTDYVRVLRTDGKAPTAEFDERFRPIRESLVRMIRDDLQAAEPVVTAVATAVAAMASASATATATATASSPAATGTLTPLVIGPCRPELRARVEQLTARLRNAGLAVTVLEPADVLARPAAFEQAQTLVLPVNRGQPLNDDMAEGGHLAVLRRAWNKRARPGARLVLLDHTDVPPPAQADAEQSAYLANLLREGLMPEAELLALFGVPAEGANVEPPAETSKVVRLFIESNQVERTEWALLGSQIQNRWRQVLASFNVQVPVRLTPMGLPVDRIHSLGSLDSADGFIMLWGRKPESSVLSQINKVENMTQEFVPGIVAFLSPPQPPLKEPVPALGWQVLRFDASSHPPIAVEDGDGEDLNVFLTSVLMRCSKRLGLALH